MDFQREMKRRTINILRDYSISYETARLTIVIIVSAFMTAVFFGMAINIGGVYVSDTPIHIDDGMSLNGYGLETIFIYILSRFTSYPMLQLIFAVTESFLVILTWLVSQELIERYFDLNKWTTLFISTGLLFLTALYIPYFYPYFYAFSLGSQPWHNSTYYGMRLFAVVYLIFFYETYPKYLEGINVRSWISMALTLAIATMFKPNFLLTVCFSLTAVLLASLIKHRSIEALKNTVIMGSTVIPSMVVLAFQYVLIYKNGGGSEESGIAVVFISDLLWEGGIGHMLIKFARSLLFPLYVLIEEVISCTRNNKHTDPNLRYSIWMFFVSVAIYSVFKETGIREYHGNFGWGIPVGLYIMFLYTISCFFQKLQRYISESKDAKSIYMNTYYFAGAFILAWHLISGIAYFINVAAGTEIPWTL